MIQSYEVTVKRVVAKTLLVLPIAPMGYVFPTFTGDGMLTISPLKLPLASVVTVPIMVGLVQVFVAQFHWIVTVSFAPKPVPDKVAVDP